MDANARSVTLINLRVLAKLKAGDRLQCVDSRYFSIDRGWLVWLSRWVRSDNRINTIDRISETFERAKTIEPIPETLISEAKAGVKELLATYVGDDTTCSKLEHIIAGTSIIKEF
jgi:hypothetical protein